MTTINVTDTTHATVLDLAADIIDNGETRCAITAIARASITLGGILTAPISGMDDEIAETFSVDPHAVATGRRVALLTTETVALLADFLALDANAVPGWTDTRPPQVASDALRTLSLGINSGLLR